MKAFILTFISWIASQAGASTFVGNGGNAGDLELQMTLRQVQESFYFLNRDRDVAERSLCTCKESFEGRPVCDVLKDLNAEQVRFCAKYLTLHAVELENLSSSKGPVNFSWTHQAMEVAERGLLRGVDAVTNFEKKSMVLNQARFLQMNPDERVFLIGHELFHLTSHQGTPLMDEGEIGPFNGEDGGRKLINAMAATLVMTAHEYQVFSGFRDAEKRSKSYKKTWVSISYGGVRNSNDASTAYDILDARGPQLGIRYQWSPSLGILAQFSSFEGEKNILNSIQAKERRNILSLGGAFRWFPFSHLLTFSGQSHLLLSGTLDFLSGNYELKDPSTGTKSQATAMGASVNAHYYLPFESGLWAYGGFGYSHLPARFNINNQTNLEYKKGASTLVLGVAYGF